jgi:hypothetical protein
MRLSAVVEGAWTPRMAELVRYRLREAFPIDIDRQPVPRNRAILFLTGLTPATLGQPRAYRRKEAAVAMSLSLDTFQKGHEARLIRDVAYELWDLLERA